MKQEVKVYNIEDLSDSYCKNINKMHNVSRLSIIKQIKSVADFFEYKYTECEDNIYYSDELFKLLDSYYKNYQLFLNGKLELVSLKEVAKILSAPRFERIYITTKPDTKNSLKRLTKYVQPKALYNQVIYFDKKDIYELKNELINIDQLYEIFKEKYSDSNISKRALNDSIRRECPEERIDFLCKKILYRRSIINSLQYDYYISYNRHKEKYYSMGMKYSVFDLKKLEKSYGINRHNKENKRYINRIKRISNALGYQYIEVDDDVLYSESLYNTIKEYIKNGILSKEQGYELISTREVAELLKIKIPKVELKINSDGYRTAWYNLLEIIKPKFYNKNIFYFDPKEVDRIKENFISYENLYSIMKENYNIEKDKFKKIFDKIIYEYKDKIIYFYESKSIYSLELGNILNDINTQYIDIYKCKILNSVNKSKKIIYSQDIVNEDNDKKLLNNIDTRAYGFCSQDIINEFENIDIKIIKPNKLKFINYIKTIAKKMKYPYIIKTNEIFFDKPLYDLIKLYCKQIYVYRENGMKLIPFSEIEIVKKYKIKEIDFINIIQPVIYYKGDFQFDLEMVLSIESKFINIKDIYLYFIKKYGYNIVSQNICLKDIVDKYKEHRIKFIKNKLVYKQEVILLIEDNLLSKIKNIKKIDDKIYNDILYDSGSLIKLFKLSKIDAIKYIKSVAKLLKYKILEDNDDVYFNEEFYNILKKYCTNLNLYFKDTNMFVELKDLHTLINNIGKDSKIYSKYIRGNNKWLDIDIYYNEKIYFRKSKVIELSKKIEDINSLYYLYRQKYNTKNIKTLTFQIVIKKYFSEFNIFNLGNKKFYDKCIIDLDELNILCEKYNQFIIESKKIDKDSIDILIKGYSVSKVAELLGIENRRVKILADEGSKIRYSDKTKKYIDVKSVDKWINMKKTHIEIKDIVNDIEHELILGYDVSRVQMLKYINKVLKKWNHPIPIIDISDTCFGQGYGLIKNEDKIRFIGILKREINAIVIHAYGTKLERIKFELNNYENKIYKKTFKYFKEYTLNSFSKYRSKSVTSYTYILKELTTLKKELHKYNDNELEVLLINIELNRGKCTAEEMCKFIEHLKIICKTNYKKTYIFDREKEILNSRDIRPYTKETYYRFGFLILSDTHIWYESYLKKAIKRKVDASVWLYSILCYICGWRSIDIIEQLPRPTLNIEAKEFLDLIRNNEFTKEMANDIVNEVKYKIKYLNLKPKKIDSNKVDKLVLEIPESIIYLVGMLLGICEAHLQLSNDRNVKTLIARTCKNQTNLKKFFGEEYIEIFGEEYFNSERAIKNYEMQTTKNGDDMKLGTGYIIASIARNHISRNGEKAKTTSEYLKYFIEMDDSEILIREMFERGVCSFVPYILAQAVYGKEKIHSMKIEDKRNFIEEKIPKSPYELELITKVFDNCVQKSKSDVEDIINYYKEKGENPNEKIKLLLKNIIYGLSGSKTENIACIPVSMGIGCIYPKRKENDCFGCGKEIYFKSYLNELGNYIQKIKQRVYNSKTKGSQLKYKLILNEILVPILKETMTILKEIYNVENIAQYKHIVLEDESN